MCNGIAVMELLINNNKEIPFRESPKDIDGKFRLHGKSETKSKNGIL